MGLDIDVLSSSFISMEWLREKAYKSIQIFQDSIHEEYQEGKPADKEYC